MLSHRNLLCSIAAASLLAAACGPNTEEIPDLPSAGAGGVGGASAAGGTDPTTGGTGGATGGTGGATGGTGGSVGGSAGTGGSVMAGSSGGPPATGGVGVGGAAGAGGTAGDVAMGGTAGDAAMGGTAGDVAMGGTAGTDVPVAGMGGSAGTGGDPTGGAAGTGATAGAGGAGGTGAYAARTGSFKMLAYSKTSGFRHTEAIAAGQPMLTAMGAKQGFTVTFSENAADFSAANLAQYEIVFALDPTGNNLSNQQKADFEDWMTNKNGAFAGVHSATDHENGWAFYSEVTGQYYDLHDNCCQQQNIQWDSAATEFIAVKGLPSPWQRSEEWYKFNSWQQWSAKPGFQVLSRVTTSGGGTRPVSYIREWGNFRSFYTSLGHEGPTYSDANFIKHVSAGIMWAVRREALLQP